MPLGFLQANKADEKCIAPPNLEQYIWRTVVERIDDTLVGDDKGPAWLLWAANLF